MSKISGYANSVSALGTDDLLDVSEKISSSPDVYESRKMTGAILAAFIQTYAKNILENNGLTMTGNQTHDLNNLVLTFQNAGFAIEGAQTITSASAIADIFNLYDNTSTLLHRFNNAYISLFGGGIPSGSEKLLINDKTKITDRLELSGTTDGFLMPRLTTAQKNAIATPDTHLFVFDTDLGTIERYDGSKWVTQAGNGVLGIANTDGSYVYYGDYNSAIAAASAGDTIEQFGDIVETGAVSLTIDKNITIQMNGYSYTLDNTGTTDCVVLAINLSDIKILNGTINRINGTGGRCLYANGTTTTKPTLNLEGTTLYTDYSGTGSLMWVDSKYTVTGGLYTGAGNILMDTDSKLTNFTYNGSGYVGAWRTGVMISNGYIYTTNSSLGLYVLNGGEASNVTVKVNGTGNAIENSGKISNCEGYSSGGIGIYANAGATLDGTFNCYGYSDSSYGIQVSSGNIHNCVARSVGSYGMLVDLRNNPEVINCVAWSSANAGMWILSSGTTGRIVNCFAQSELNTTSGHAFLMDNGVCRFINCTGKVANAGAYGISGGAAAAYITNFTGEGMTTLFNGVTQLQTNTEDAYGNKLIG